MRGLVVIVLLSCVVFPLNLMADSAGKRASKVEFDCEASVDGVDDMNFVDTLIACDDAALVLYDDLSRRRFMRRKALAPETFARQQRDGSSFELVAEPVHLPGARFIIRSGYNLSSPQDAWVSLYQQMATYCPAGWQLDRQWSTPDGADYFLHYEFTCADRG